MLFAQEKREGTVAQKVAEESVSKGSVKSVIKRILVHTTNP